MEENSTNKIAEPQVLTHRRTDYGKRVRKAYEAGQLKQSRHEMEELVPREDGITNTLTLVEKDNLLQDEEYRIRKLTPRECFRLMGCDEKTIDTLLSAGISNTQAYKLAGNSIVVDVLYHIFRKMFVEKDNENQQLTLF